jgi:hypothetical protein
MSEDGLVRKKGKYAYNASVPGARDAAAQMYHEDHPGKFKQFESATLAEIQKGAEKIEAQWIFVTLRQRGEPVDDLVLGLYPKLFIQKHTKYRQIFDVRTPGLNKAQYTEREVPFLIQAREFIEQNPDFWHLFKKVALDMIKQGLRISGPKIVVKMRRIRREQGLPWWSCWNLKAYFIRILIEKHPGLEKHALLRTLRTNQPAP